MSTADILRDLHRPDQVFSVPSQVDPESFADRTRQAVDDIVGNVAIEFNKEIGALRKELDAVEQLLIAAAGKTKGEMGSYVDLVCASRDLTRHVRERIQKMRSSALLLNEEQNHA